MQLLIAVIALAKLLSPRNVKAEGPPKKLASDGHRQILFAQTNETVTLKCPVETSDFYTFVEWTRGNASLYMRPGYEITNKGHLKIKSVSSQQAGVYTCEAVNGYGMVKVNLTLVVDNPELENKDFPLPNHNSANRIHSVPPTLTKRPSPVTSEVGHDVTFHCVASGQPVPRLFWLKEGLLIQGSSSYVSKRKTHATLRLKGLRKSDEGSYKCLARNVAGEDEADFSLRITESSPPPKIVSLDPPNVTVQEGASIAFVCEVASRPGIQVHIKWLKKQEGTEDALRSDNINLFRSGQLYYRPLNLTDSEFAATGGGVYKSKLLIRNSGEADAGTYVCLALSDKGYNFRTGTLKVIGRPRALENSPHLPENSTPLVATITVVIVLFLVTAVSTFLSHRCCSRKGKRDKAPAEQGSAPVPSLEGGMKQGCIRNPKRGDFNRFPDLCADPLSSSKLLTADSVWT